MPILAFAVNVSIVALLFYYWSVNGFPKSERVLLLILTVVLILVPLANVLYTYSPLFKNFLPVLH